MSLGPLGPHAHARVSRQDETTGSAADRHEQYEQQLLSDIHSRRKKLQQARKSERHHQVASVRADRPRETRWRGTLERPHGGPAENVQT